MGCSSGPDIAEDGLVFCVDAASKRSYPGTGTTCTDLKNGFQGTLQNSPTFTSSNSGAFTFDGTDERILFTDNIAVTEATFLVWIKRSGDQATYGGIVMTRGDGGDTTGLNFYSSTENLGYHWNDASFSYSFNSGLTVPDGEWCMVALSVSSSAAVFYLYQDTGLSTATKTASHTSSDLNAIEIGGDPYQGGRQFNGDIAMAHIYNRALSADEIRQNYLSTKERFA